ncbi:MAG: LysR family transcriptional regulator [Pseudomonadales bacterium]|nr:LysR family transcriptional regulator [Pseudomonadales bacterium]NRA16954.1 LysR family transcriptional regulator [Oceanospirillaceae bacterium]
MDFRSLRYFVAVYEEHSFSAAAKRCFVAQPSISGAVQQLESELECALFVRHSKGITPTTEGTALYPKACQVLADVQQIKQQFQENPEQLSFKLALLPFLSGKRVSKLIQKLMQTLPNLDLTLVDANAEADARIISQTVLQKDEIFHKLWVDRYVLAVPLQHPLTKESSVSLEQLNNCSFISRSPCDIIDSWQFAIAKRGLNLKVKATVKTEEYALDLVAAGLGVSIVPLHSLDGRADLSFCEISDLQLERVVGLAYSKNTPVAPSLLAAITNIKGT